MVGFGFNGEMTLNYRTQHGQTSNVWEDGTAIPLKRKDLTFS